MEKNRTLFKTLRNKFVLTVLLLFFSIIAFAQPGGPGQGDCGDTPEGPDAPCPLDTWVIVFAVAALIFVVVHLHRKQNNALKANRL